MQEAEERQLAAAAAAAGESNPVAVITAAEDPERPVDSVAVKEPEEAAAQEGAAPPAPPLGDADGPEQLMGDPNLSYESASDEAVANSTAAKVQGAQADRRGDVEAAVQHYTDSIVTLPSALAHSNRAAGYIKLGRHVGGPFETYGRLA